MKTKVVEDPIIIEKNGTLIPQPTRFWILDKELRKEISRLEEKGVIKQFSEKITKDDYLFKFFLNIHLLEVKTREEILKQKYPEILKSNDKTAKRIKDVLLNTGVGGIGNFKNKPFKVKCLHLWTAYHLGDKRFENPIGEYVLSKIKI